ncbi:hypothetical protein RRG08_052986 [Elysia crispata]|uniref:Uncharacterized protein n=1 Tax=Elysia crispata TaxID=231223 RepID=A0AAE0ZK78_9GAST|nr:hypothetical protein RRG08_052986 [Elysia crispata]
MVLFTFGWAWHRGLAIRCGCTERLTSTMWVTARRTPQYTVCEPTLAQAWPGVPKAMSEVLPSDLRHAAHTALDLVLGLSSVQGGVDTAYHRVQFLILLLQSDYDTFTDDLQPRNKNNAANIIHRLHSAFWGIVLSPLQKINIGLSKLISSIIS